jgi:signal transduction histidine kinase
VPSLFVIRGNDQGTRFELDAQTSIGRDPSSRIRLHDNEVSRRHAEIQETESSYQICDLGSSNGTFVNSRRVDQHPLTSGDQVQLGRTLMLYTSGDDESVEDLAEQISIVPHLPNDRSRIVHSISHDEGSRIFDFGDEAASSPWLARARSNLQVMYRTSLAVSHTLEIDQLLERILQLIFDWVHAERGCIMLADPETGQLQPKVYRDRQEGNSSERLSISQTILDFVMQRNEGVLTTNAQEDRRWNPAASIVQQGIHEAICVPMQGRYDVVGLIYIDTTTPAERVIQGDHTQSFNDEHLKLMIAIAHQAALAVEDTFYYKSMVQAERLAAVGQTIATLSHHIKNILQGIRGGSYLIEMGLSDKDDSIVRKGWNIVEKNQSKISTLVMDMLTFSKEREPELQPGNVNEVVQDVVELMETRAGELEVQIEAQLDEAMPTMTFDPEGIHRVVLNLVTNAMDASDQNEEDRPGRVVVSTAFDSPEQTIRIIVQDNGSGIEPEDLKKIFTIFVSKKGSRGTGLGLPVSEKIVREHGGRIHVESTPGEGSRFTIELPAVSPDASGENLQNDSLHA